MIRRAPSRAQPAGDMMADGAEIPRWGRRIGLALAGAVVVRLAVLRLPSLWFDESTTGLMGLAVLRGELPVYFFSQAYMGALDAYLAAPLYAALGVSVGTLKLLPSLLSTVWLALVVWLAWDAVGPRSAFLAALAFLVPPDALLAWSSDGRTHYVTSMVLATTALVIAWRAPAASGPRGALRFGLLGVVTGLAFWTNLLTVVYLPALALLALRGGLRRAARGALVAIPGFALGSLPHWLYSLPRGQALPPAGPRITLQTLLTHLGFLARVSWPQVSGVPEPLRLRAAGAVLAWALAGIFTVGLLGLAGRMRRGEAGPRWLGAALVTLVATTVSVAVGTQYGRMLETEPRYLFPLYSALPALLGAGLAGLRRPWMGSVLAGTVLAVHGASALSGSLHEPPPPVAVAHRDQLGAARATLAALLEKGPHRLYGNDAGLQALTFLSRGRVVYSHWYEEGYPPFARAVDGAAEVGWWARERAPALEATFRALGAEFRYARRGPGGVYMDFDRPARPLRELDPAHWVLTASEHPEGVGAMIDRQAETVWGSDRHAGGEWLQVDLGRIEPVSLVRWLPGTYQEVPSGIRLEVSRDGHDWERLLEVPHYVGPLYWSGGHPMGRVREGRVELWTHPTPTRYLRLTQTGSNDRFRWTVRELFIYGAGDGAATPPVADGPTLAQAARRAGVRLLYADHGWGSRVAIADPVIRIVPANLAIDPYGDQGPAQDFLPPVVWREGSGVLLEPVDAEGFAREAQTGGLGFTRQSVGGLELFVYVPPDGPRETPIPSSALRASASRHPELAARVLEPHPERRWATHHAQTPGDWFQVDLTGPRSLRGVRLWTASPTDWPRGLLVQGSEDGAVWRTLSARVRTEYRYRWGGIALLRDAVEAVRVEFPPTPVRSLRLTLTRGDPVFDWSIRALTVFGDP